MTADFGPMLTERFSRAFDYARVCHAFQLRKETTIPYLSHLMGTSAIVLEYGGDEDQAIAGLLHDAAEDAGGEARLAHIAAEFGDAVAAMVESLSDAMPENKADKPPWFRRKVDYHRHLAELGVHGSPALLVSAADKLHNLQTSRADHRRVGGEFWGRFNDDAGREGTLWNYVELADVLGDGLAGIGGRSAALGVEFGREVHEFVEQVAGLEGVDLATLRASIERFREEKGFTPGV